MEEPIENRRKKYYRSIGRVLTLFFFVILGIGIWVGIILYPGPVGPAQPIPFSHRIHAGVKQISCLVCHTEATQTSTGGIPPLATCMHCHTRIITSFAPIRNLHKHYYAKKPVEWTEIYDLPDFVHFPHSVHVYRGVDCSHCHGDVKKMDRVMKVQDIDMGFCIRCHRQYNATVDCFSCHR